MSANPHFRGPAPQIDLDALRKIMGNGLLWLAAALLLLVIALLVSIRIEGVKGTEVGVFLNKLNGEMEVIPQSGMRIYNGITHEFYVLDKTMQTVSMEGDNSLKLKTIDGSDVYIDLKVQYKIDPMQADKILVTSGPGDAYKRKWVNDYIRSICRDNLGELTTEEFYDATKRTEKIKNAKQEADKLLRRFAIKLDYIGMPKKPTFYKAYEDLIKQKKLADQAVYKEQSKAKDAEQKQKRVVVEEEVKKRVAITEFQGKMDQMIIQAKAEAEKARKAADAYYDRVTIGATADFYQKQKQAEGTLEQKSREAQGILALKKALEGEGGRNMVKLEYARRLRKARITGMPYTVNSQTERFEYAAPAAAVRGVPAGK